MKVAKKQLKTAISKAKKKIAFLWTGFNNVIDETAVLPNAVFCIIRRIVIQ